MKDPPNPQERRNEVALIGDTATCPISAIPPEILTGIFVFAQELSSSKGQMSLIITWVSRYWRELALSTSELWTHIDSNNLEFIQTTMSRAGNQLLSIDLSLLPDQDRLRLDMLLETIHRIRALKLGIDSIFPLKEIQFEREATVLEILELDSFEFPLTKPFPASLPSLRVLELTNCYLDWNTLPDCPQLQSFSVSHPDICVTAAIALNCLRSFPQLKSLELDRAFDVARTTAVYELPSPIVLPQLEYLDISAEYAVTVLSMLKNIRIPSTCRIRLSDIDQDNTEYLQVFPLIRSCRTGIAGAIRTMKLTAGHSLTMSVIERQEDNRLHLSETQVDIWPADNRPITMQMTTHLCQDHLALDHLETLDINSYDCKGEYTPPNTFWDFIDSLPNLQTFKVRDLYAKLFGKYLSGVFGNDTSMLPFKRIRKLVYEKPGDLEYASILPDIEEYLRRRKMAGCTLQTLTLVSVAESCIPANMVEGLAGFVGQVKRKEKFTASEKAVLI